MIPSPAEISQSHKPHNSFPLLQTLLAECGKSIGITPESIFNFTGWGAIYTKLAAQGTAQHTFHDTLPGAIRCRIVSGILEWQHGGTTRR
jgi:hypothetical protein